MALISTGTSGGSSLVAGVDYTAAGLPDFNGQAGIMVPTVSGWGGAGTSWTASRVYLTRFVPSKNFTVTSVKFRETTAGTGNVDVGIYNSALTTKHASSGSTAAKKGANAFQTVALSATFALVAGTVYYLALESDTTDGAFGAATFTTALHEQIFGSTDGLFETGYKDTTFPLPATLTSATANGGGLGAIAVLI